MKQGGASAIVVVVVSGSTMASDCGAVKQYRYDPSMSRRTRKPPPPASSSPDQHEGDDSFHHVSLKELMTESNGEEKAGGETGNGGGEDKFIATKATSAEVKTLALVTKQGEGGEGVKMASMVGRCVKVLNHLVKSRRGSKKRSAVRLLMQ